MDQETTEKYQALQGRLRELGSVAVALSGGVDSTLLAKVAHDVLGDAAVAITAQVPSTPAHDASAADDFCRAEGIRHLVVTYDELSIPHFAENPRDRCYWCKHALFSKMREIAAQEGISHVADGSNKDDEGDYRPGLKALAELGAVSPLRECGITKAQIRTMARELGVPVWDSPSSACLASRIPYGERITEEKLRRVEEAEDFLRGLGIRQVRVRMHGADGKLARIEVSPQDVTLLAADDTRQTVARRLHELGFTYVSLDLDGFRSGSMNAVLS